MIGGGIFNHPLFSGSSEVAADVVADFCLNGVVKAVRSVNGIVQKEFPLDIVINQECKNGC